MHKCLIFKHRVDSPTLCVVSVQSMYMRQCFLNNTFELMGQYCIHIFVIFIAVVTAIH